MATFNIWSEGFNITGNQEKAHYYGTAEGATFIEACANFRYPANIVREYDKAVITKKGQPLAIDGKTSDGRPTIWGCALFDSEADARKSFG